VHYAVILSLWLVAVVAGVAAADDLQPPCEIVQNSIGMKLVRVAEGEFSMGSHDYEMPVHRIRITKSFLLGQTEVTQRQWERVMGDAKPWQGATGVIEGPDVPVTWVSWNEAVNFCEELTVQERREGRLPAERSYRLPTEAEWEYACRAGTKTRFSFGNDEEHLGDHAWFIENTAFRDRNHPQPVSGKKPNPWKLYDMHGNVAEWCSDWYDRDYYSSSPADDPQGPASARSYRVIRGGNWHGYPADCRSAFRLYISPANSNCYVGFRVVCDLD
jgi:formylglycine-generating enzyme required for sulfatase activity